MSRDGSSSSLAWPISDCSCSPALRWRDPFSSIIGIGALIVIALNWAWLARGLMFGRYTTEAQATPQRAPTERRRIMAWLLFAIFYLAVTAWLKVFVSDPAATDKAAVWMLLTFSIIFALTGYRTTVCRKQQTDGTGTSGPDDI